MLKGLTLSFLLLPPMREGSERQKMTGTHPVSSRGIMFFVEGGVGVQGLAPDDIALNHFDRDVGIPAER